MAQQTISARLRSSSPRRHVDTRTAASSALRAAASRRARCGPGATTVTSVRGALVQVATPTATGVRAELSTSDFTTVRPARELNADITREEPSAWCIRGGSSKTPAPKSRSAARTAGHRSRHGDGCTHLVVVDAQQRHDGPLPGGRPPWSGGPAHRIALTPRVPSPTSRAGRPAGLGPAPLGQRRGGQPAVHHLFRPGREDLTGCRTAPRRTT